MGDKRLPGGGEDPREFGGEAEGARMESEVREGEQNPARAGALGLSRRKKDMKKDAVLTPTTHKKYVSITFSRGASSAERTGERHESIKLSAELVPPRSPLSPKLVETHQTQTVHCPLSTVV